ncbi:sensor histidine kinase [Micromonospora sp. NPDC003197]
MATRQQVSGWIRTRWQLVADLAMQGLLVGLFLVSGAVPETGGLLGLLLGTAQILPLLVRRQAPGAVLAVVALATSAQMLLGMSRTVGYLPALLAIYTAAGSRSSPVRWWVCAAATVSVAAASLPGRGPVEGFLLAVVAFTLAWLAGAERGQQLRRRTALVAERTRLRLEQRIAEENRVAAEERELLARRLHDTLAHTLTVMVVQTEALRCTGELSPAQRERVDRVLDAGRTALTEIRHAIADLDTRATSTAGDNLRERLDELRAAGLDLPADLPPMLAGLPEPLRPVLHRLIGEVTTNALRHDGPGSRLEIWAEPATGQLQVTTVSHRSNSFSNDQRGVGHAGESGGYGLRSLGQDVKAYGGELTYGPVAPDRWRVTARFHIPAECIPEPIPQKADQDLDILPLLREGDSHPRG